MSCSDIEVSCHALRSASVIGTAVSPVTRTGLVATSLPPTTSVTRYSPGSTLGPFSAAAAESASAAAPPWPCGSRGAGSGWCRRSQ